MWLSNPNHMVAPPNLAPPEGVRYKVIKFLKKTPDMNYSLRKNAAKNVDLGHLMRGEGGSAKGDCFVHL